MHQTLLPIDVLPLFPVLDQKLIVLLQGLTPADWQRPTLDGKGYRRTPPRW